MSFCTWDSGEYYRDHFEKGIYVCSNCGIDLFHSSTKYAHHTPWPAFHDIITPDILIKTPEIERPNAIKI